MLIGQQLSCLAETSTMPRLPTSVENVFFDNRGTTRGISDTPYTGISGQWLKWSCKAGGGAQLTKPGWSKPHIRSTPN